MMRTAFGRKNSTCTNRFRELDPLELSLNLTLPVQRHPQLKVLDGLLDMFTFSLGQATTRPETIDLHRGKFGPCPSIGSPQ